MEPVWKKTEIRVGRWFWLTHGVVLWWYRRAVDSISLWRAVKNIGDSENTELLEAETRERLHHYQRTHHPDDLEIDGWWVNLPFDV